MNNILEAAGFLETREAATLSGSREPAILEGSLEGALELKLLPAVRVRGFQPTTGAFYEFVVRTDLPDEITKEDIDSRYEAIITNLTAQGVL